MRSLVVVSLAAGLSAGLLAQTPQKTAAELAALGPQLGQRVADFSLTDQSGATRTLQSILGPNGAILVFFRSADW